MTPSAALCWLVGHRSSCSIKQFLGSPGARWHSPLRGAFCLLLLGRPLWRLDRKALVFLVASMAAGPGLLANTLLKDHWGRARPARSRRLVGPIASHRHRCPRPSANATALLFPVTRHSASRLSPCFLASTRPISALRDRSRSGLWRPGWAGPHRARAPTFCRTSSMPGYSSMA